MLDSWFGNTAGTRRKHYSATAVSQNDRIAISGAFANNAGGQIVVSSDASENPNQHISDAVKSGDVGKLRDLVQFVLDEADSETPEKLAEYTRRDSNPQPSVPKTDALSS